MRRKFYKLTIDGIKQNNFELLNELYSQLESSQEHKKQVLTIEYLTSPLNNSRMRELNYLFDRYLESLKKAITFQEKNVFEGFKDIEEARIAGLHVLSTEEQLNVSYPKILRNFSSVKSAILSLMEKYITFVEINLCHKPILCSSVLERLLTKSQQTIEKISLKNLCSESATKTHFQYIIQAYRGISFEILQILNFIRLNQLFTKQEEICAHLNNIKFNLKQIRLYINLEFGLRDSLETHINLFY